MQVRAIEQKQWHDQMSGFHLREAKEQIFGPNRWYPCRGLKNDFIGRLKHYVSDYTDGVRNAKSIQKLMSTMFFLFFACLLPSIAFGVLNDENTHGAISE